ncbi:MAG TPA: glycosyltransferase, partial [Saprospiraceae bacterium]|nr:glycosyltransferase [Saprospiraceae bacterium]
IAGTGELEPLMREKCRESGLEGVVHILGFRGDIQELCSKSHVMLMPSLWEGFPIVLLEAGLSRLPVISTQVGSIAELIDHKTGYTGEIAQFEQLMTHVMENYDEAKSKGALLHERIKDQFNMEKIAAMHEKMYEDQFNKKSQSQKKAMLLQL